jgi:hypothetical protein
MQPKNLLLPLLPPLLLLLHDLEKYWRLKKYFWKVTAIVSDRDDLLWNRRWPSADQPKLGFRASGKNSPPRRASAAGFPGGRPRLSRVSSTYGDSTGARALSLHQFVLVVHNM